MHALLYGKREGREVEHLYILLYCTGRGKGGKLSIYIFYPVFNIDNCNSCLVWDGLSDQLSDK